MTSKATWTILVDWDNNASIDGAVPAPTANEDVTANVLGVRTPLAWKMGRDGSRSISGFLSADVSFELDNRTRIYSPDNSGSALFGNLGPGRPVRIRATSGTTRDEYRGFIDGFKINPHREKKSVSITCLDAFAHISDAIVSTPLYKGIRTGEAFGYILDAVGWPVGKRDINNGCTTIRHWWVEGQTAGEAIKDVIESEGPPSVCYVDGSGNFVFRDRAHRLLDANATAIQATFRDTGTESATDVNFSEPAEYDVGFEGIVNSVSFDVEERIPVGRDTSLPTSTGPVWSTEDTIRVAPSATVTVVAQTTDPFSDALIPQSADLDYVVADGAVSAITLSRTSGASTIISITATAAGLTMTGLRLRAISYPVGYSLRVTVEDATSIALYGRTSWTEGVPKWCGKNDAEAIANIILTYRKDRLPVFSFTVNNGNANRLAQILDRAISDRITVVEAHTGTNHAHHIESIEYNVDSIGYDHRAYIAAERAPTLAPSSADIFILDSAVLNHRLDSGKLGY